MGVKGLGAGAFRVVGLGPGGQVTQGSDQTGFMSSVENGGCTAMQDSGIAFWQQSWREAFFWRRERTLVFSQASRCLEGM